MLATQDGYEIYPGLRVATPAWKFATVGTMAGEAPEGALVPVEYDDGSRDLLEPRALVAGVTTASERR